MKKVFIVAGIIVLAIVVGIFVINVYEADTEVTRETTKVGMILNGTIDDHSWGESHYVGMKNTARELNLSVIYKEAVSPEKVPQMIKEFADEGCKVVIAISFAFGEAMSEAAKKYPDIYFLHATGTEYDKNLSTYFGRIYQIRYLCGIVAGLQTETNEIGYVAAFPIPEVNRGINAFALGVRSVNPEATVYVSWAQSWEDDEATEDATNRLLDRHSIDVLTMHSDSLAPLQIADERGVMSIGYNLDNSQNYPDTYLTAAVWDWEAFYTPIILKCLQGKFEGQHYWEGIESGIVSIAPLTDKVSNETKALVVQEMKKMTAGTFDVFYGPIYDNEGRLRVEEGECMTDYAMLNEFDWYVEGVVNDEEK